MNASIGMTLNCPQCGGKLDQPGGLCPACLARVTFGVAADVPERLRQFGDYELIEELGRGGMGIVYKARQRSLNRMVALKMILTGHFASRAEVQRFRLEAQNAAALTHPNIVSIYEVGEFDGQSFYAMELLEGRKLSEIAREPLPPRQAAHYVKGIAEAVHTGHCAGIIHRDLKPANVLIDPSDEPHVMDFGLSKNLDTATSFTQTGQALGSPAYMAPEQAFGSHEQAGPASDVYSLGAILYQLLTGRPPFQAASVHEVLRQVTDSEPLALRLLNPAVPRDLETICLKCLAKESLRRYETAQELADELARFLADEPIQARPVSALEKVWRWSRRHPAVAGLSAAVIVLLVIVALGSLWSAFRLKATGDVARSERDRARRTSNRLKLRTAEQLLDEGNSASALALLAQMLREEPTNRVAAGWIMDVLDRTPYWLPAGPALDGINNFSYACFSPDGRRIAAASTQGLGVWDTTTGEQMFSTSSFGAILFAEFSVDGRTLACAGGGKAWILDAATGRELAPSLVHDQTNGMPVFSIRFDFTGTRVVTATRLKFARVWSVETGAPLTPPLVHEDEVNFAEFSPDGQQVLTASEDDTAMVWDAVTGTKLVPPMRHGREVWMARFSPDGKRVATVSRDRTARIWDSSTGQPLTEPMRHEDFVEYLHFSPDGRFLVTASYDKTARIWDTQTGYLHAPPLRHRERVISARFSPDGKTVLTASHDGTARLWDTHSGQPLGRALNHTRRIWYADFSPDGERILTSSGFWRLQRAAAAVTLLPHESVVTSARFAPDGRSFATATYDGNVSVWQPNGSRLLLPPIEHPKAVTDLEFSRNGELLATSCRDGIVRVWDTSTAESKLISPVMGYTVRFARFNPTSQRLFAGGGVGALLWDFTLNREIKLADLSVSIATGEFSPCGKFAAVALYTNSAWAVVFYDIASGRRVGHSFPHGSSVRHMEFSPDGRYLLTASGDGHARVWDIEAGQLRVQTLRHKAELTHAQFDNDAQRIVTASADGSARVWNAITGYPVIEPLLHRSLLDCVCFSPDGNRILTASRDGTARLWEAASGEPALPPMVHQGHVTAAGFSPDGRSILTASRDGTARLWTPTAVQHQIPAWLPEFAEAMASERVNEVGAFEFVPRQKLEEIKVRMQSLPDGEPFADWGKKLLAH